MPPQSDEDVSTVLQHRFVPTDASDAAFVVRVMATGATLTIDDTTAGPVLCGKSPVCALRIDDPAVSRRHFSLEVKGEELHLVDLGSTNRTRVNNLDVESAYLRGGETIQVGSAIVQVARTTAAEGPAVATASRFGDVIGASREMRRLYTLCAKLAASQVSVVIEGETGTGKEALAEAIHDQGPRAKEPFIVFDCTAVPPNLIESDLFGHERGAFTGAVGTRKGVFEQAHRGTLLIDEIGDLDLPLQAKLLRAIERGEIRRVGGNAAIRVDARILAATRRDLDAEVQAGRFRDDLFHRLAVARIELPPLRTRKGDIPLLVRHFWSELGGAPGALPPEVLARWEAYAWPGNVRELRNAVARQMALGEDAHVPMSSSPASGASHDPVERVLAMDLPLARARDLVVEEFERRYLERVLARHGGNVTRAAAASGIARRHFYRLRARSQT